MSEIPQLSFFGWIIVGGLAGSVAGWAVKAGRGGCIVNIVVGILGAFLGGFLFSIAGIKLPRGNVWSFFVALFGAVVFLMILKAISGRKEPPGGYPPEQQPPGGYPPQQQ